MPKFSTSARRSSHQDGKKKSKHRGHQYLDATRARKLKQTRFKGIVEEIVEPVESGKPRPLKRTEVVNIVRRKQATATDDDGDTTDVDDSEDLIVLPAGFIEVAEMLGVLNPSPASSGPRNELEEPLSAPELEEPPVAEQRSSRIETPLNSPPLAVPQTIPSVPSPSTQSSRMVPEPVEFEVVNNDSQTAAATSSAPIPASHTASVPESFQDAAWSSASQLQHPTFWQNDVETSHFHQQDIQNRFYLGSSDDDVNMEFLGEATMEPPTYSVPTMWTSSQPRTEHQIKLQIILMSIGPQWAHFQPAQNESVEQFAQTNQPQINHPIDPFAAAIYFWTSLSEVLGTSQSPTIVPEIIKSTPIQSDEQRPDASKLFDVPIHQDNHPGARHHTPDSDGGFHPFPNLRGCKSMRLITGMSGGLEEPRITQPVPGRRRVEKPPVGSEMDLVARLKRESEGPRVRHRKRRHEDSQPEVSHTKLSPRQRRRCEPDPSKLKTTVPAQKRNCKRRNHRQHEGSLKGPPSRQPPTEWGLSSFCPSISSLADHLFKFF